MEIAFFAGAYGFDDSYMSKIMFRNRSNLKKEGIFTAGKFQYRQALRMWLNGHFFGRNTFISADRFLRSTFSDVEHLDRCVLSFPDMLASPKGVIKNGIPMTECVERARLIAELFKHHEIELHFAVVNPLIYLEDYAKAAGKEAAIASINGATWDNFWSAQIQRIRATCPNMQLHVWAQEDMATLWGTIMRNFLGTNEALELASEYEFIESLITEKGTESLRSAINEKKPTTNSERFKICSAILAEHENPLATWQDLSELNWSSVDIQAICDDYESDLDAISQIEGVMFIS